MISRRSGPICPTTVARGGGDLAPLGTDGQQSPPRPHPCGSTMAGRSRSTFPSRGDARDVAYFGLH